MSKKKKPLPPEVAEAYRIISQYNHSQMTPEQRQERARKAGLAAAKVAKRAKKVVQQQRANAGKTSWASLSEEERKAKIEALTEGRRKAREKRNGESQ